MLEGAPSISQCGELRRCTRCTTGSTGLPVIGGDDRSVEAVLRPHPDGGVGAIAHRNEGWRIVKPVVGQFDSADRRGGIHRDRLTHSPEDAGLERGASWGS